MWQRNVIESYPTIKNYIENIQHRKMSVLNVGSCYKKCSWSNCILRTLMCVSVCHISWQSWDQGRYPVAPCPRLLALVCWKPLYFLGDRSVCRSTQVLWGDSWRGLVARKARPWSVGWNSQPEPHSHEKGEQKIELMRSCLYGDTPIKSPVYREISEGFQSADTHTGKVMHPSFTVTEAPELKTPRNSPCASLHAAAHLSPLSYPLINRKGVSLSPASRFGKLMEPEEGVVGTPVCRQVSQKFG